MTRMDTPDGDRLDDVEWALTEGGHSFWSWTDSQSSFTHTSCRQSCDEEYPNDDCPAWAHRRGSKQCIALNSSRSRCNAWVLSGTPFCDFHFKRAFEALYVAASQDQRQSFERFTFAHRKANGAEVRRLVALEIENLRDRSRVVPEERVYFFVADHAVKIGRSIHPELRVRTLHGTKCPDDVDHKAGRLLGTIVGSSATESHLHRRFASYRLAGEWFAYEPIADQIQALLTDGEAAA